MNVVRTQVVRVEEEEIAKGKGKAQTIAQAESGTHNVTQNVCEKNPPAHSNLGEMFGILMDEKCHITPSDMKTRVEEYGISQPSDVLELDTTDVEGFANMLKIVKKRAFLRLYSEYATPSAEK